MKTHKIALDGKGLDSQKIYERNFVPRAGEVVVIHDALHDEHQYVVKEVVHNFCCAVDGPDAEISLEVVPRK